MKKITVVWGSDYLSLSDYVTLKVDKEREWYKVVQLDRQSSDYVVVTLQDRHGKLFEIPLQGIDEKMVTDIN